MWPDHQTKIEALVGDGLVLDIGGWCDPFLRADYVLDVFPYETRGLAYHGIGKLPISVVYPEPLPGERFTKKTWFVHDICSERPFPFPDKILISSSAHIRWKTCAIRCVPVLKLFASGKQAISKRRRASAKC